MNERTIAKRYARALLLLAIQKDNLEGCQNGLRALSDALEQHPRLSEILVSPVLGTAERRATLDAVLDHIEMNDDVRRFAELLVERRRADLVGHIARTFDRFVDDRQGLARATVTSAVAMDQASLSHIRQLLTQRTGCTVILTNEVDASILGGAVLRVGNRELDASARSKLRQMIDTIV